MALLAVSAPLHRLAEPGIVAVLASWTGGTDRFTSGLASHGMTARITDAAARAVMIAAGFEPLEPYSGNNAPWRCRCVVCQRESTPAYGSVKKGHGCGWCAGLRVDPADAHVVMAAADLEPLEPYPGSDVAWWCRCLRCNNIVAPRYNGVRQGKRCRFCAGNVTDERRFHGVMIAAGLQPLEPYPGRNNKPWRSRCRNCEREVSPTYANVSMGKTCAYCSKRRVDPTEATAFMIEVGLQPLEPYPGAGQPWRCKCTTCNREVSPTYGTIRVGGGCRFCAPMGIDYAAPGIVYLMHHPEWFVLKVGVSTAAAKRVRVGAHTKTGWVTIGTWDTPTGDDAEQIEQQILGWWRGELGAPVALTKAEMPNGFSETAALIHVDIDDTINRITRLVAALP